MSDKKECFIIMPITTPESMIEKYRDGEEHFTHVLNCLFIPAIDKAGYNPIPPKAKGADIIQAEIIKNLETAEIILCDMSSLNPNVFFEFGIRTSLNKSVCVVKDDLTESVPFDPGIINHHEYKSSLEPWHLESEINNLSAHLTASSERSKGENTLWKYFGMKAEAEPYKAAEGSDNKLDYITLQMDSLREKVDKLTTPSEKSEHIWCSDSENELNVIKDELGILRIIKQKLDNTVFNTGNESQGEMRENVRIFQSDFNKRARRLLGLSSLPVRAHNEIIKMSKDIADLMTNYFQMKPK